jgi:hypothetical protein
LSFSRQNFRFKFHHNFRHLALTGDFPGKLPLTFGFFGYILYRVVYGLAKAYGGNLLMVDSAHPL